MTAALLKARMQAGDVVYGLGVRLARSTEIVSIAKATGFDWIFVDMEHSAISIDLGTQICCAAADAGLAAIVRVPGHEPTVASRLLDNGAGGIMVPHVDEPADILPIVRQCKFAPIGHRSYGGILPQLAYRSLPQPQHMAEANAASLIIPMIESPKAVENAAAIAAVPGVDLLNIGTNDLAIEMGLPGQLDHPRVAEAYKAVGDACKAHGKLGSFGGIGDVALLRRYLACGFNMVLAGSDLGFVVNGACDRLKALRGATHD